MKSNRAQDRVRYTVFGYISVVLISKTLLGRAVERKIECEQCAMCKDISVVLIGKTLGRAAGRNTD